MRYVLLLLLIVPFVQGLEPSEIYFDAPGRDYGLEWIELIGTENLTGCTIQDLHSSDPLEMLTSGNEVILIVESDHTLNISEGPTVYGAGKAIGNGLSNSQESITISCEDELLLSTEYDVSAISNMSEGKSIVWNDGWVAGSIGGTLGSVQSEGGEEEKKSEDADFLEDENDSDSDEEFCNATLLIRTQAQEFYVGDMVRFSIVSEGFASFWVSTNGTEILAGDTLTKRNYAFAAPKGESIIRAVSGQCDATQRATKTIVGVAAPEPVLPLIEETVVNESNTTIMHNEQPEVDAEPVVVQEVPKVEEVPIATGAVIYDRDANVVPWVSGFGMLTLLVSAALFFQLRKEEKGL